MRRDVVVFGAGGLGREVVELLRDCVKAGEPWAIEGFITDDAERWGESLNGLPVLGGREWLREHPATAVVLGVGSSVVRARLHSAIGALGSAMPVIVHPSVVRSASCDLDSGTVVAAGTILTANVQLGPATFINLGCTIGHDVITAAAVTLSPGVHVSGNVRFGAGSDVGTGAVFVQGLAIGAWTTIGAGAVVTRDLPDNCTAVGVPARVIKTQEVGWQLR